MTGRIVFPPTSGPLSAEELAFREDDPSGARVAAMALTHMRGDGREAGYARRPSRPRGVDRMAQLERLRRARDTAEKEIARAAGSVSAAARAFGLDLPASQVARELRQQGAGDGRTSVRRLTLTGPSPRGRTPFQVFGGVASQNGPNGLASFPSVSLSSTSPSTHGTGFAYRWRFRFGRLGDAFGGDPFYEECLEQAEQSYRPAYVYALPPLEPGFNYGSYCAMFLQDDDSAYQFTGKILRRDVDLWESEVDDLSWFAGALQSAIDPEGGAAAGWRPISIAAARYERNAYGMPAVEQTDYVVAWLRDGMDPADHRVLFATLDEVDDKVIEYKEAGFRPFSGVRTEEGVVTLWVRDDVQDWVMRPSLTEFLEENMPNGYRPIHVADGVVIGVKQTDDSVWDVSDDKGSISTAMNLANLFGLQVPCFALNDDHETWTVATYLPRRGIGGLPVVTGTPIEDFIAAGDVELDRWLREEILATKDVSAAVLAVARDGQTVVSRGYSFGTQAQRLTQPDTPFRIASVAKPLTAVAVMRLIEEYHTEININSRIFDVPGMPQPVGYPDEVFEIRIKDLLQHRCGWGRNPPADPDDMEDDGGDQNDANLDGPLSRPLTDLEADLGVPLEYFKRSQMVEYGLNVGGLHGDPSPIFGFDGSHVGTTFRYSNFGYMLLAQLIEVLSPYSYASFVQTRILDPLGMTSTRPAVTSRFHVPRAQPNYDGYRHYMGDPNAGIVEAFGPSYFGLWSGDSSAYDLPDAYGGSTLLETVDAAGGWVSSAPDMLAFLRAFDGFESGQGMQTTGGQEILSPFSLGNMWGSPVDRGGTLSYLMGWFSDVPLDSGGLGGQGDQIFQYSHGGNSAGVFALAYHKALGNVFMAFNRDRLRFTDPTNQAGLALANDAPP